MVPDYSFELYVGPDAREQLLLNLRPLCAQDSVATLDAVVRDPAVRHFDIFLALPPDPSIHQFAAWWPSPTRWDSAGMVVVGMITVWLESYEADGKIGWMLTLWPAVSTAQKALLNSPYVWQQLVHLLEHSDGQWGLLDDASGAKEVFWSRESGPITLPAIPIGTFTQHDH